MHGTMNIKIKLKVPYRDGCLAWKVLIGTGVLNKYLKEIGLEGVGCIDLAQDRKKWWAVVNAVMNLRVP